MPVSQNEPNQVAGCGDWRSALRHTPMAPALSSATLAVTASTSPPSKAGLPWRSEFHYPYDAARHADTIVLVTDWHDFIEVDWNRVRTLVRKPVTTVDRNCLDSRALSDFGFDCAGIGR